jgi:3-deoxy-D-manno-octulosonic-acid transferase
MTVLLDVLYLIGSVLYLPVLFFKGKWHDGFRDRFGRMSQETTEHLATGRNIWIHAVSVGEVMAIEGLIAGLKARYPGHQIVLSVTTKTGHALARRVFSDNVLVLWAPLDFSWVARRFLKTINPVLYIAAETELWPNLFRFLSDANVPIVIANGRISDEAFPRYRLFRFFLFSTMLRVKLFCMQSRKDADRILLLGAQIDKVKTVGNVKFDRVPGGAATRLQGLGIDDGHLVLVGGSTHPGEEEILLDIFQNSRRKYPSLRLILAPRHPERSGEVAELIRKKGFVPQYFSEKKAVRSSEEVLIVDRIGHLMEIYAFAAMVFVGKSLTVRGGHNIIEPAILGKPVLIGPHMQNFLDVTQAFVKEDAVIQVPDRSELERKIVELLENAQKRQELGRRAIEVIRKNQGATQRTLDLIAWVIQ